MKLISFQQNFGHPPFAVTYWDGKKRHKDGRKKYDTRTFICVKKWDEFIQALEQSETENNSQNKDEHAN